MIDRATKVLLTVIAIGLFANVVAPLLYPRPVAAESNLTCTGELKANAWGGTEPSIGGYSMKLTCEK
jgi:hypothetical protein